MQKNCIESLQCHRQMVEQEWSFSFLARHTADFMTKGRHKVWGWWAKLSQVSTAIGCKFSWQITVFYQLSFGCQLCHHSHTSTCPVNVRLCWQQWHPKASDFPPCYRIKVSQSGHLPSCLTNPDGSLVAGMLAEPKDCQMMSFRTWCLAILPGAFLHTSHGGRPWVSTWSPHGCMWDTQN